MPVSGVGVLRRLPLAAVLVAYACGGGAAGGTGDGGGGFTPVTQADFPNAAATAICSNISPCCAAAGKPFNESSCEIVIRQVYQTFASTSAAYDPVAEGACVSGIAAAVRKCDFSGNSSCAAAGFGSSHPHGKVGDACNWSCTATGSSTSCSGIGTTSRVDAGPFVSCYSNDGLYCDEQASQCAHQKPVGAPCTSDQTCANAYCPFSGTSPMCTAKLGEGASCASNRQACAAGLYCDFGGSTKCTRLKADGASCTSSQECSGGRCQNGKCGPGTTILSLACAP